MKEIHIAQVLMAKRREKGITQEELARYIGVTKASVSKWETGQSYPDITFLPQLAAYFDMSIDDLMGYEPQVTREGIRELYFSLCDDFVKRPFEDVLARCEAIIKKYYSCYPLLYQMGVLLINHSMLPQDATKSAQVLSLAQSLFLRIKSGTDDVELAKQALSMQALCALSLGKPEEVLELLGENKAVSISTQVLTAAAYQALGNLEEARCVLQIDIFQHLQCLLELMASYLPLCVENGQKYEETCRRYLAVADAFELKKLHPAILMNFYISAAQGYLALGRRESALDALERYTELVTGNIYPLKLHGDAYFDLLEPWINEFVLGSELPRDERIVRQSMVDGVEKNVAFEALREEKRFIRLTNRLKSARKE